MTLGVLQPSSFSQPEQILPGVPPADVEGKSDTEEHGTACEKLGHGFRPLLAGEESLDDPILLAPDGPGPGVFLLSVILLSMSFL